MSRHDPAQDASVVWMVLVNQFLIIWAMPFLTGAAIMLLFDRFLDTNFFHGSPNSNAILYQHLFWSSRASGSVHPDPAGIRDGVRDNSGLLRKPIFGYTFVAMSGVAIGSISFIVWAHHMFTVGLGTDSRGLLRCDYGYHCYSHRCEDLELAAPRCGAATSAGRRQ